MCRIISHRLRGFDKQEATLAGLQKAMAEGVPAIEIDTRLTKDRKIVISHDADLKKEFKYPRLISTLTAEEISELRMAKAKCKILTLEELLSVLTQFDLPNFRLFVDIKETGYEENLIEMLDKNRLIGQSVIISWLPECLFKVNRINSSIPLCFSHYTYENSYQSLFKLKSVKAAEFFSGKLRPTEVLIDKYNDHLSDIISESIGYDYEHIARLPIRGNMAELLNGTEGYVCCHYKQIDRKIVDDYHGRGIKVIVYSIDDRDALENYAMNVKPDYILTNNACIVMSHEL